jgi:hypothetical protein
LSSWPLWLRTKVRQFVTAASGGPWPGMRDQAARLLEQLPDELAAPGPRRAAPERPRGGVDKSGLPFAPPQRPTRMDRRDERNARMRRIWAAVHARAGKRCEWCRDGEAVEVHHTLGGSDRTALEDEKTCCGLCEDCHERTELEPIWDLEQSLAWARRLRFSETAEILEGKLALAAAQARPITRTTESRDD